MTTDIIREYKTDEERQLIAEIHSLQLELAMARKQRDRNLIDTRDKFAMAAMTGLLASWKSGVIHRDKETEGAYKWADAMLKARES